MSLDVYLVPDRDVCLVAADYLQEGGFEGPAQFLRSCIGEGWGDQSNPMFEQNITHNLGPMAGKADLYLPLWRPEEMGITHASQLIEHLEKGLEALKASPAEFELFTPSNKWGSYEGLVKFVAQYLEACRKYPFAVVEVSR